MGSRQSTWSISGRPGSEHPVGHRVVLGEQAVDVGRVVPPRVGDEEAHLRLPPLLSQHSLPPLQSDQELTLSEQGLAPLLSVRVVMCASLVMSGGS